MGIRLYDTSTGRFLSTDPVAGGNANAYDYCGAEPVGCTDLWSPFYYASIKFNKRETLWMAGSSSSASGLLSLIKDYGPLKAVPFKHVIALLRFVAWYIARVSWYATLRGKCTKVFAGATRTATWLGVWNAYAVKC
ncbi:RHS repeat-associated core domain-containing protein [Streptomyces sp. NPDC058001]|uniref:RHS repeat-associated core domain-containing protein n=1 Tax=Streptomyces sp. NPDC058001 TaxID=3346300 RepID=UPI0036E7A01C